MCTFSVQLYNNLKMLKNNEFSFNIQKKKCEQIFLKIYRTNVYFLKKMCYNVENNSVMLLRF